MLHCLRNRALPLLLLLVGLHGAAPTLQAEDTAPKKPDEKVGDWVALPPDGSPWRHGATGLLFPQSLGGFTLHGGFRDKQAQAGLALTYTHPKLDLKADIVIYPCTEDLVKAKDITAVAKAELARLVNDLLAVAKGKGYVEKQRSQVTDQEIGLWEKGAIPMVSQTLDFVSAGGEASLPGLNQWLSVLLYQDHVIQLSVTLPAASVKD